MNKKGMERWLIEMIIALAVLLIVLSIIATINQQSIPDLLGKIFDIFRYR